MPSPAEEVLRWLQDPERQRLREDSFDAAEALLAEALDLHRPSAARRLVFQLVRAQQRLKGLEAREHGELIRLAKTPFSQVAVSRAGYALRRVLAKRGYSLVGSCLVERGVGAPSICSGRGFAAVVKADRVALVGDRGDRLIYVDGYCVYVPRGVYLDVRAALSSVEGWREAAVPPAPKFLTYLVERGLPIVNLGPCSLEEAPRLLARASRSVGRLAGGAVAAVEHRKAVRFEGDVTAELARLTAGEWRYVNAEGGRARADRVAVIERLGGTVLGAPRRRARAEEVEGEVVVGAQG
jgi:hypothetical protein